MVPSPILNLAGLNLYRYVYDEMMQRAYYSASVQTFLNTNSDAILGSLTRNSEYAVDDLQKGAWIYQIEHLRDVLKTLDSEVSDGEILFEYVIPRMGRRIDVLLVLRGIIFILEYKVGESGVPAHAMDQATDYALDLKNFHETSHSVVIAPLLVATELKTVPLASVCDKKGDRILNTLAVGPDQLVPAIEQVLYAYPDEEIITEHWAQGRYQPTPTIVEAATALYAGHNVQELSRSDAGAINLSQTSHTVEKIIEECQRNNQKAICFVTGVPGAGKTLVGLNVATKHFNPDSDLYSVFLSGNGPLVKILHEALARDRVAQSKKKGDKLKKTTAKSEVKAFIQNVHHFRDEGLKDELRPPIEHVALFDEAQRAWDLNQTVNFMKQKKGRPDFNQSEPSFLISCMDRHKDWSVVVCLVGGGQEINKGEAGIGAWLGAIQESYPSWKVYASPNLNQKEYQAEEMLRAMHDDGKVEYCPELHLSVSMRSFRAETVSAWVKAVLDGNISQARELYQQFKDRYPIVLTRDLTVAKDWTRQHARGSERYGLIVSSNAQRLKPYAIDVRTPVDPVHWFLNDKSDVRSSYYLEDVATEFQVQGLELDWSCVAWDADFRRSNDSWKNYSFRGNKWQNIHKLQNQRYQMNAYRVLLTRARQGMAIVVPAGDNNDLTRKPEFYDETFSYLSEVGLDVI